MEYPLKKILLFLLSPLCLFSLSGKPEVIQGHAEYELSGGTELVRVSDKTILEYQKFDLQPQEITRYEQPSSKSTLLCRIKGKDPSTIRGKLEANGKLLLINPNGIIFSETAQLNVGTLIASVMDIQNDDFLKNRFKFKLSPEAYESSITHQGQIHATGHVVFMAPSIIDQGIISAKAGKTYLLSGEVITLDFDGDDKIQFAVEAPLKKGSIELEGEIESSQIFIKLSMAQKVIRSVLNDTGVVEANHIEIKDGGIFLRAGSRTQTNAFEASADTIQIAGKLDVSHRCQLKADQDIQWLESNKVGHLSTNSDRMLIKGKIEAKEVNLKARQILQDESVISKGPLCYTAPGGIFLGHNVIADKSLTFDGPVTVVKRDEIHIIGSKYKSPILLTSTLDAALPSCTLHFQNDKSVTEIKGAIGLKGPLGNMVFNSGKVILHDTIGGERLGMPGIQGSLTLNSNSVEGRGSTYYTGEQLWNVKGLVLTHEGDVALQTTGLPLRFSKNATIQLGEHTHLKVHTQGGDLDLPEVSTFYPSKVTIQTGGGEARLQKIGESVSKLQVESRDIRLAGQVEAGQIFMEVAHALEYDESLLYDKGMIRTAIKAEGPIVLNSKQGILGSEKNPLNIATKGDLFVGAKTAAYLTGRCSSQLPQVYPSNSPPHLFFNGYELPPFYLFMNELIEDEVLLYTLAPALSQQVPTGFMDGAVIKPRKALIYYDISAN